MEKKELTSEVNLRSSEVTLRGQKRDNHGDDPEWPSYIIKNFQNSVQGTNLAKCKQEFRFRIFKSQNHIYSQNIRFNKVIWEIKCSLSFAHFWLVQTWVFQIEKGIYGTDRTAHSLWVIDDVSLRRRLYDARVQWTAGLSRDGTPGRVLQGLIFFRVCLPRKSDRFQ